MTAADRRISELIDKWLASIDLHLKYVELSDAAYALAQTWPKHDRPTRWVLEVARQKVVELKSHCEARQAMGDAKFSESLELMAFLANLVGIQHIQRFIPMADPSREAPASAASQTVEALTVQQQQPAARARADDVTREMPRLKPAVAPKIVAPTRNEEKKPTARPAAASPSKAAPVAKAPPVADLKGKIIADAVRLLKWGKSWHELPETIARIADRPPTAEIRKVLRTHKGEIEAKASKS